MATITANGSKGHHKFTLEVTESNYSVNNNTSDVSFTFKIAPIQSGYNWSGWGSYISYTITIDGTNYTGTIGSYNGSSTVTLKSDSKTGIQHNNDGTKTISFSFTVSDTSGQSYTCGNATKSGSLVLTTIPRASQIGVTNADIGSSTNITINKASNEFTTTLFYKASGQNSWTKIVDKTSLQVYPWTVPTSFYALTPNSKTITCQFYADTYNGDMFIGNSSIVTATFTATGNPTISNIVAKDLNPTTIALTGNDDTMVKYASNVRVTVTASGQNSATISSIKINNVIATGGVVTFNGATTNTYQVVVTDSRGYTTSQTKTMIGANYIPLTINQTISRNQPTDNKINITASGNYYPGTFGATLNSLTVEYRYKERSSATWGSWTNLVVTISGNTYSGNTQLSNMDYTKIYDFEVRAKDKVYPNGEKTITGITVSKGTPVFNWDDDEFRVNTKLVIPKSSTLGIRNTDDYNILSDYANQNVVLNASGAGLFLGYLNTTFLDFMHGKGKYDTDGNFKNDGIMNNTFVHTSTGANTGLWCKLANLKYTSHQQGEFTHLKIMIGRGQSSSPTDNAYIDLYMQVGYIHNADGRLGCYALLNPLESSFTTSNTKLKIIFNSNLDYDIWFYTSVSYVRPSVVYSTSKNATITKYYTTQASEPSGTACSLTYKAININTITNPLPTKGDNSNGYYIRFPNLKLQICYFTKNLNTSNSTSSITTSGNVYYIQDTWTFPVAFSSAPIVIAGALDRASGVYGACSETPTTSNVVVTAYGPAGSRATGYNAIAIGPYS